MEALTKKPIQKQSRAGIYTVKRFVALVLALMLIGGLAAVAAEAKELIPVGRAVGIRLEADGVVIAGIPDTCADGATPSPAKDSGLCAGDIIVKAGGSRITSGEELKALMRENKGEEIAILVERGDKQEQIAITPKKTQEGSYSLGILAYRASEPSRSTTRKRGYTAHLATR